jgi:hypothetical protein
MTRFSRVKPLKKPVQEADPDRQPFGMQVSPYDVGRCLRGLPEQLDKMSEVGHLVRCPSHGEIPFSRRDAVSLFAGSQGHSICSSPVTAL